LTSDEPPAREGMRLTSPMVMDGLVNRSALQATIEGMVQSGELDRPLPVDNVLKDAAAIDTYERLLERGIIDPQVLEQWRQTRKGGADA